MATTDTRHLVDLPPDAGRPQRERDRTAMRRLIADHGFDHAADSLAQAVAVAVTEQAGRDYDQRLEQTAGQAEATVLDSLVHFARQHGWRGAR